ncbi:MAG: FG-GAP-like repeat-containing protein [Saprospiraceae bacterium]
MYFSFNNYKENPTLGIADFNQDGIPEVYCYNRIFNAQNGVLLIDGGDKNGVGNIDLPNLVAFQVSVAAQLDQDLSDIELAAGYSIYKVKINNINGTAGNTMTAMNILVNGQYLDGRTAVADINLDGQLDVIVAHSDEFGAHLLYVYTLLGNVPTLVSSYSIFPNINHLGTPTIADIDGDGKPNILLPYHNSINSFTYNNTLTLYLNWNFAILDSKIYSSIPTFDLNGDGIPEIIHRGDSLIYVIDARTNPPTIIDSKSCYSITLNENCTIADIDNTGSAKICITCNTEATRYSTISRLSVFGSPDSLPPWAPARGIWNQYAYNPLFINDDLTVPQYPKNQATYKNGKYNNFMQQESYVDSNGMVKKAAASLSGRISCINYDVKTKTYSVIFDVYNRKDASQDADTNLIISFYSGDPNTNGIFIGSYHMDQMVLAGDSLLNLVYRFQSKDLKDLFMVVNTKRTGNGSFGDSDFIQLECDYTDNISRSVDIPKIETLDARICSGDRYNFFGNALSDSGTYEHKIYKFNGCDSVITILQLNTVDTVHSIQNISTCDSYFWNGQKYTLSGIYQHDTLSTNGCDSSTTLNLIINNSDQQNIIQSACDSLMWNGMRLDQSGSYEDRRINSIGCDSITTLQLTVHQSTDSTIIQSACDHYDWNGKRYDQSGTYTYQGQSIYGCDSIITLQLTIDTIIQKNIKQSACNAYTWDNKVINQSGTYQSKALSQQGCDSITTLDLTIHTSSNSTTNIRSCDTYTWNGNSYTNSGTYTFKTQNAEGCDSTATLNLQIDKSSNAFQLVTSCDSLLWNGTIYTTSGTYTYSTQNSLGCDSTVTLNLSIQKSDTTSHQQQACDSYNWNGKDYTQSGLYQDKMQNIHGCDSIINLNLTIHKSNSVDLHFAVCDSLNFMGKTLNKNGSYQFTLQNAAGCDSTINLNLRILSNNIQDQVSSCDSFHWNVNNADYNQSGIYTQKYINSQGCDSIYTLTLNISKSVQLQEQADACKEYYWPVNKTLYTQSGDYKVPLQTIQGCDSILQLKLTIHPEYEKTDTVFTHQDYVWKVDQKNYTQSGTYEADFVSKDGCDSIHLLRLSINKEIEVYAPNVIHPGGINEWFSIFVYGGAAQIKELSIYDRWGSLVWQKQSFPPNELQQGWNGLFKGQKALPGVYVWSAVIELQDGSVLKEKGDVNVVR